MGCTFSCKRSSLLFSSRKPKSKSIKIVHLDGYVEVVEPPVTVAQLTGLSQKHFLFSQAQVQLLAVGAVPLKMDDVLVPGRAYFLLPYSLFEANVSPLDLAPVARKLVTMSQSSPAKPSPKLGRSCPNEPYSDRKSCADNVGRRVASYKEEKNSNSWKPILASIQEMSMSRRIGSDLAERVIMKVDDNLEWY